MLIDWLMSSFNSICWWQTKNSRPNNAANSGNLWHCSPFKSEIRNSTINIEIWHRQHLIEKTQIATCDVQRCVFRQGAHSFIHSFRSRWIIDTLWFVLSLEILRIRRALVLCFSAKLSRLKDFLIFPFKKKMNVLRQIKYEYSFRNATPIIWFHM